MKTIWKYKLDLGDKWQVIAIPGLCSIVHVGVDYEKEICLWALVHTDGKFSNEKFMVTGTGSEAPVNGVPVGSLIAGYYVWHVWQHNG